LCERLRIAGGVARTGHDRVKRLSFESPGEFPLGHPNCASFPPAKFVGSQDRPVSVETSTAMTGPESPLHATPANRQRLCEQK
jgi:hypothetical protein